ncbi:MAG: HAMP domain-containing protein [Sulfuritalea sp.]|nr:HAMP domain-containing protein [Sulfuritalea sp.]MDP1985352.1 HAMP domain-containing protein [Sulfuritalea sp.]
MFSRRHTIYIRLMMAYKLLLGTVLLLVWITGLLYIFASEREEVRESAQSAGIMLAAQSSAALMFGDRAVLQENLASLKGLGWVQWAAIVPTAIDVPLPVIRHGDVSADPIKVLEALGESRERIDLFNLIVRTPISHAGIERGQLLISIDLHFEVYEFVGIIVGAAVLLFTAFVIGQYLFHRVVNSIVAPLEELVRATAMVALRANSNAVLEGTQRPRAEFLDEIGQLASTFNLMLDSVINRDRLTRDQALKLEQSVEDLRALSARMRAVREEERTRISHEIHDELGQRLTALKFEIARLDNCGAASDIAAQIDELIRAVRVLSWELRPSVLDSLGLVAAIEWQAQDFARRMGIRCGVDLPEEAVDLPSEMATDLFRICQELLTNVSRHAQANRVDLILETTDDAIHLEIKDDGRGMQARNENSPSLGLLGIRDRLERWGGHLDIGPGNPAAVRCGTRIHISIPLGRSGAPISSEHTQ